MLRRSVGVLLALVLLSLSAPPTPGGEDGAERTTFGVPAGVLLEYQVRLRYGDPEAPGEDPFRVKVLRPEGDASDRVALVVLPEKEEVRGGPRLTLLRLRPDGVLLSDQRSELGPERADFVAALFASVEGPSLAPGARWSGEESVFIAYVPLALDVEHAVSEDEAGRVVLSSRLTGEKTISTLGYGFTLKSWTRTIVANRGTWLPVKLTVSVTSDNRDPQKEVRGYARTLEADLAFSRKLSREESRSLVDEISRLEAVAEALRPPSSGGGGLLGALFGGAPPRAEPVDPLPLLDDYDRGYPEGLLAAVTPGLRQRILERQAREERARKQKERAEALLNAPAPDFTLEGLDGKKVSLSDFRGKVVLLAFWGYG